MFKSKTPLCSLTSQPSTTFCCTQHCQLPAFGCSESCLQAHPHGLKRRFMLWNDIAQLYSKLLMEAEGLSQEDVKTLERQQKELAKLIGELQEAIKKHEESVRAWRKRMKLGGAVKDLNYAITYGRVETITGDDMARLVTQLQQGNCFVNKSPVEHQIYSAHKAVDALLKDLKATVEKHLHPTKIQSRSQIITRTQLVQFSRVHLQVDLNSQLSSVIQLDDNIITVRGGLGCSYYPIFSKHPLKSKQCFCMQITKPGHFMLGVAAATLKDIPHQLTSRGSMCVIAGTHGMIVDGTWRHMNLKIEGGDAIEVKVDLEEGTVEWVFSSPLNRMLSKMFSRPQPCKESIPLELRMGELYAACWILSQWDAQNIAKLRIL